MRPFRLLFSLTVLWSTVFAAIWNLNLLTLYRTGFSAIWYIGYGCHCGLGGNPNQLPVDAVDACCYHHDRCFGHIEGSKYAKFFGNYYWEDKHYNNDNLDIELDCSKNLDAFARALCECDIKLVDCWGQFKQNYHVEKKPCRNKTYFGVWWGANGLAAGEYGNASIYDIDHLLPNWRSSDYTVSDLYNYSNATLEDKWSHNDIIQVIHEQK